ncbi:unnamed protein product [Didymodactylos carnosus]|uniref:EF-hand domain-containing protein n=1 Tax=Didymodactylos carnosus TaxID=1234261 RepID=A0A813XTF4_9BILA|nr:unnamed protein product [Didymodactylos carnosus]CAF0874465.1 unnamed protein product [Didymodactylos carnosus]CAF3625335.1 unnamed protein product [Didymodactylos carnosus]CAF3661522.1 unnamed protein product [Didymodactylos carnosus]
MPAKSVKSKEENSKVIFKLFDVDNTGKISLKNLKNIAKELGVTLSDEELKEMFAATDLDGDGSINEQEFMNLMKKNLVLNMGTKFDKINTDESQPQKVRSKQKTIRNSQDEILQVSHTNNLYQFMWSSNSVQDVNKSYNDHSTSHPDSEHVENKSQSWDKKLVPFSMTLTDHDELMQKTSKKDAKVQFTAQHDSEIHDKLKTKNQHPLMQPIKKSISTENVVANQTFQHQHQFPQQPSALKTDIAIPSQLLIEKSNEQKRRLVVKKPCVIDRPKAVYVDIDHRATIERNILDTKPMKTSQTNKSVDDSKLPSNHQHKHHTKTKLDTTGKSTEQLQTKIEHPKRNYLSNSLSLIIDEPHLSKQRNLTESRPQRNDPSQKNQTSHSRRVTIDKTDNKQISKTRTDVSTTSDGMKIKNTTKSEVNHGTKNQIRKIRKEK